MTPFRAALLCVGIVVFIEVWRAVAIARAKRAGRAAFYEMVRRAGPLPSSMMAVGCTCRLPRGNKWGCAGGGLEPCSCECHRPTPAPSKGTP